MPASRRQVASVVWLEGNHDIATVAALAQTMAEAIAADDANLVVDLSRVEFMGAAPIAVLVRAREFLRLRSRSLSLRAPPPHLSRLLGLCGLADLVDPLIAAAAPRPENAEGQAASVAGPGGS